MNIVFKNKLAFDCFHNMRHVNQLTNRFKDFLFESWINDDQIHAHPRSERPFPATSGISGYITEIEISVCGSDCYLEDEKWHTYKFDWIIWRYEIDGYGYKTDTKKRIINGVLINHGTPDDPRWSSHT